MNKKETNELGRIDNQAFQFSPKLPIVVVLDNIRSQHNIGSVFRTADAFRLSGIALCGITAVPPQPEIHKAALGATETVSWSYFDNTIDAVLDLKSRGFSIIAIEQTHESIPLLEYNFVGIDSKIALVLGHEVFGISDNVLELCDLAIEVPMFGTKHSLNISVCAGIVIWDMAKRFIINGFQY